MVPYTALCINLQMPNYRERIIKLGNKKGEPLNVSPCEPCSGWMVDRGLMKSGKIKQELNGEIRLTSIIRNQCPSGY